jgi:hypothetical protein
MKFVTIFRNLNQISELKWILVNFCEVVIVTYYAYAMIVDLFLLC